MKQRFNNLTKYEFFDTYLFYTLDEVKIIAQEWINDYNHHRPHAILGKLSPIEYLNKYNSQMNYSV